MFLSQSAHEITGCNDPLESPSSITCVMYAAISTANPFLTQTNGPRYETRDFLQIFARSICRLIHVTKSSIASDLNVSILLRTFRSNAMLRLEICTRYVNISTLLLNPELFVSHPRGNKVNRCLH